MSIKSQRELESQIELANNAMADFYQRNNPLSQEAYDVWVKLSILYVNAVEALAIMRGPVWLPAPRFQ